MSKPKTKTRRSNSPVSTAEAAWTPAKPPRPTHADVERAAERSDIEQAAGDAARLADAVVNLRQEIRSCESLASALKSNLSTTMLQHQEAVTKLNALALIPQPVL